MAYKTMLTNMWNMTKAFGPSVVGIGVITALAESNNKNQTLPSTEGQTKAPEINPLPYRRMGGFK